MTVEMIPASWMVHAIATGPYVSGLQ